MIDHLHENRTSHPQIRHDKHEKHLHREPLVHGHDHEHMIRDYWRRFTVSTILTIPILVLSPSVQEFLGIEIGIPGSKYLLWSLASIVYFYGGKPFLIGLYNEVLKKLPGMMTLIGVAISIAYIYSTMVTFVIQGKTFFWELATLIDVMLLGHWIEMKSVLGASKALEKLVKALPSKAHLIKNGVIIEVDIASIKKGDEILVKPGEKIPVDGVVVKSSSSIDESLVTGESKPVFKTVGSKVIAGTINLDGSLVVKATAIGGETYLSQVIELIKSIQESRSRVQDLANRVAKWLTIIALTVGSITFIVWINFIGDPVFALERAVTVMVITCPHALGLAIPLVIARSTAMASTNGILIRNRIAFEKTYKVDVVVLDKTGTLTKGRPSVVDVVSIGEFDKNELLKYIASLEKHSSHPLAEAIVKYAEEQGIALVEVKEFKSIPGRGVEGVVDGYRVLVASPQHILEKGLEIPSNIKEYVELGYTVVLTIVNERVVGAVLLEDEICSESFEAINELKKRGIHVVMLTGDSRKVAERVAEKLGIEEFYAEVLPHQKVEVIREIKKRGMIVAMVGDGVNDAPALIEADVGIAIGAGMYIAIESADIILVKNDPRDVVKIIDVSEKTYRKIRQNLVWAVGYNVFAIPAAAGLFYSIGLLLPPAVGALLMSISTVIVAVNASLLK